MAKLWIIIAGLLGAGAVALGAYHAHGLEDFLKRSFQSAEGTIEPISKDHAKFREKDDANKDGVMDEQEIAARIVKQMHNADVAVKYQMYHALAILGIGILLTRNRGFCWFLLNAAALLMLLGVKGFSGGIFFDVFDIAKLHWSIIPIGGLLMIIGWVVLAIAGIFVAIEPRDE